MTLQEADIDIPGQREKVFSVMADGQWHTLSELAHAAKSSTQSASARVRDLRKRQFGAHTVERQYVSKGVYVYRLMLPEPEPQQLEMAV